MMIYLMIFTQKVIRNWCRKLVIMQIHYAKKLSIYKELRSKEDNSMADKKYFNHILFPFRIVLNCPILPSFSNFSAYVSVC